MQRLRQSVMPYILYFHSMVGDICIDYFTIVLVSLNFQRCTNCILMQNYIINIKFNSIQFKYHNGTKIWLTWNELKVLSFANDLFCVKKNHLKLRKLWQVVYTVLPTVINICRYVDQHFVTESHYLTKFLILLGRLGIEPLFTLAAVGLIKLWLLVPVLGWINLLLVVDDEPLSTFTRFNGNDCGPMLLPLPLLLLREEIARPLFPFCTSLVD